MSFIRNLLSFVVTPDPVSSQPDEVKVPVVSKPSASALRKTQPLPFANKVEQSPDKDGQNLCLAVDGSKESGEMVFDPKTFDLQSEEEKNRSSHNDEEEFFDPSTLDQIDTDVLKLVDPKFARQELILPISRTGHVVTVLYSNKYALPKLEYSLRDRNLTYKAVASTAELIKAAIERHYPQLAEEETAEHYQQLSFHMGQINIETDDANRRFISKSTVIGESDDAIRSLADSIICDAIDKGATDLNIDLQKAYSSDNNVEYFLVCNLRIDGENRSWIRQVMPQKLFPRLVRVYKGYAGVDIKNDRDGQSGVMRPTVDLNIDEANVELRANFLPTGDDCVESISIRIQPKRNLTFALDKIGLLPYQLNIFLDELMALRDGMVICVGGIGEGKNTTMTSFINRYHEVNPYRRIVTIEDPIELTIAGASQHNLQKFGEEDLKRSKRGFQYYLKHLLRHNPDLIMIGEIREPEPAAMAVESAGLGHLVLTTMHTANTIGSIVRLRNLNVENYLIADTLKAVVAQRLVKKICTECDVVEDLTPNIPRLKDYIAKINWKVPTRFVRAIGRKAGKICANCQGSGFRGRLGIFEVLQISNTMRELISEHATSAQMRKQALNEGLRTLWSNGLEHALRGNTTLSQIIEHIGKPDPFMEGLELE